MIRLGRVEEGMEAAAAVLVRPDVKPTNHYDVACCCSLASAAAKDKPADGERLAKQAIRHLEDAVKAGFFKQPEFVGHIHKDADMNPLRSPEDFKEFVKPHGL